MGITKFILKRVLFGVATLFIVSVLVFLMTQVLGDPARAILGREAQVKATLLGKRKELGLDRPAINQYFGWLWGLLRGDPGKSFTNGIKIWSFMGERVSNSFFLVVSAALFSIPLSLLVGAYSALRRDKVFDGAASYTSLIFAAMPEFVTGVLLVMLFSTTVWHLFNAVSEVRGDVRPWNDLEGMILPTLTLVLVVMPYVVRATRASMIEVLESDYVEMARLKGLPSRIVLWRHALPNGIGPTFQVIALSLAYLFGGVVVVEGVFNYPGIGSSLVEAIKAHNVPVVQFIAMFIAGVYVLCNLFADVGTILVTPRLRTRLS
ncbi:MAG: ABC transporter permease [Ilumatobacteraceae bacterium]